MGLPTGHKLTGPDGKAPLQVDVGYEIGFWLTAYAGIFVLRPRVRPLYESRDAWRCRLDAR